MIQLFSPWLLLTFPLPLFVYWLAPAKTNINQSTLRVPFLSDFLNANEGHATTTKNRTRLYLAAVAWLFLVFASARPQWLGEPIEQAINGRDLMLAIDLSASMQEKDLI